MEQKIAKAEKDIQSLELKFASILYGTMEFNQTQKKLENLKKELERNGKRFRQLLLNKCEFVSS